MFAPGHLWKSAFVSPEEMIKIWILFIFVSCLELQPEAKVFTTLLYAEIAISHIESEIHLGFCFILYSSDFWVCKNQLEMIIRSYSDTEKSKLTNSITPSCCYYCCVKCGKDKLFSCFLVVCCLIWFLVW